VIGPLGLAADFEQRAEAAIVALADIGKEDAGTILQELNFPRLIVIPDLAGVASLWVTARDLGGSLGFEIKKNLMIRRNHALKTAMDRAIALPLFLASLPVMLLAVVWIKLSSPVRRFTVSNAKASLAKHSPFGNCAPCAWMESPCWRIGSASIPRTVNIGTCISSCNTIRESYP